MCSPAENFAEFSGCSLGGLSGGRPRLGTVFVLIFIRGFADAI